MLEKENEAIKGVIYVSLIIVSVLYEHLLAQELIIRASTDNKVFLKFKD